MNTQQHHHEHNQHDHHQHEHHHEHRRSRNPLIWTLAALVIIALGLGYAVYAKKSGNRAPNSYPSENAPVAAGQKPVSGGANVPANKLLTPPGPNSSEAEQKAFAELVASAAVRTDKINLSSCKAMPTVASFNLDSMITLVNDDPTEHTMVLDPKNTFTVPGKSKKTIKADFGHGPGLYGYGCDMSSGAVGMMLVTQ
jgi:hypothetical protein